MKRSLKRSPLVIGLLLMSLPLLAQQAAYTSSATELKREPSRESETLQELPADTVLESLRRQGSWVEVRAGEQTGWVRMLVVRPGVPGKARKGESGLKRLFNVARGGNSGAVTTTGVRGLNKEEIQNATPNPAELAKLDAFVASDKDVRKLAESKPKLGAIAVSYVDKDGAVAEAGQ